MIVVHVPTHAPAQVPEHRHGHHGAAPPPALARRMLGAGEAIPAEAVWVDLLEPTREEEGRAEAHLGIGIPTREEMVDLEPSELLYQEGGARYMSARVVAQSAAERPRLAPVTFILTDRALVTVRYDEPRSFERFAARAGKPGGCGLAPEAVLDGLMESIIDRAADILQRAGDDIDALSAEVFDSGGGARDRGKTYQLTVRGLGRAGDVVSRVRESLASLERVFLYLAATGSREVREGARDSYAREWRTSLNDVRSIEEHATFLSTKAQFVLDATLGLVGIDQNRAARVFSITTVLFLPATLVGTIYGMNFKAMPELEWAYGYPMALTLIVLAPLATFAAFKWNRWL